MVTETETLTSTLHHNIFTYLDYLFSATIILSDFNPYLLSYKIIILYLNMTINNSRTYRIYFTNKVFILKIMFYLLIEKWKWNKSYIILDNSQISIVES